MDHDTLPPTSADAAALAYGRRLAAQEDRAAHFWAVVERTARHAGIATETPNDLDPDVHGEGF
jgi:hypothetical protein